jgi:hypothetical protein
MNKTIAALAICIAPMFAAAQTPTQVPQTQAYGKVDIADLEMKSCDFEKGANAEILFHKGKVSFDANYNLIVEVHKRIKIFNDKGNDNANVRIEYYGGGGSEYFTELKAETINLNNGVPEITKLDKKQFFTEKIDRSKTASVFTFPNVKSGSIIEYKYTIVSDLIGNVPDWYFQTNIPTKYSELTTSIPDELYFKRLESVRQPFAVNKGGVNDMTTVKALVNVPSIPDEPYMSSLSDNCQRILFQLASIKPIGKPVNNFSDSWSKVGKNLLEADGFGSQLSNKLTGELALIDKAKAMKTDAQKVAYLFNEVKNTMKWNEYYGKYSEESISKAWDKKVGNSGEINLILCRLLKKAGVKAYPMVTSTRKNGRVNPAYPNSYQFNSAAAYVPIDSTRFYVLDASNKFNAYNEVPYYLLNSMGFYMDKENEKFEVVFLNNITPVRQLVLINGEIDKNGSMKGNADIANFSYHRFNAVSRLKKDGEKKFIDYITNGDNNLKISDFKVEDMDIDTLPLREGFKFNMELTGSDDNYIYFNPNMLSSVKNNPFISDNRMTDIDFGYQGTYAINGTYTLPAGYKIDALPKSISMTTEDKSIYFKRFVAEDSGKIVVRFSIDQRKSIYFKEDYDSIHEFFKKMYEMLNEPIVLKKS